MKLHENREVFRQAIQATAQEIGIPEIFIEKDYWVTFALYTVFKSERGNEIIFKGGTSLLKCYNLIKRFSEDIDLVILRNGDESNTTLTKKIKSIGDEISRILPEVDLPNVTVKKGMNRKTAHEYKTHFKGDYGQVRTVIIVEATWIGYFEPYMEKPIHSFVFDMMAKRGQLQLAEDFELKPFMAKVLLPTRTLCEKILSLVRFSYSDTPIEDLRLKIRHLYDLHTILQVKEYHSFFYSEAFTSMLLKTGNDDISSYKSNNKWLNNHPCDAIIFKEPQSTWEKLRDTYNGDFKALVFNEELPPPNLILQTLQMMRQRLIEVNWTVKV